MPVIEYQLDYSVKTEATSKTTVIIVAAGNSVRMGGISKQLINICEIPVIIRSILPFEKSDRISKIIIVTRNEDILQIQNLLHEFNINKVSDIVEGDKDRSGSVQKGLERCDKDTRFVIVHDGARPLVSSDLINKVLDAAELYNAATCGVPVKDTIKTINSNGIVQKTLNRNELYAIQTPQAFEFSKFKKASSDVGNFVDITDDCAVMEKAGYDVYIVEGDYYNIKITTPEDILIAEAIIKNQSGEMK